MPSNRNRVSKRVSNKSKASPPSSSSAALLPNPANNNKPVFFWRPKEPETGFLSQWYASHPFRDRAPGGSEKVYATAEHYMMHHKALLFGDAEIAAAILEAPGTAAKQVKDLGRQVRGFDQAVWERERARIVTEGSWCKFSLPVVLFEDDADDAAKEKKVEGKGKEENNAGEAAEDKEGEKDGEVERDWALGDHEDAKVMRAASFRDVLLATGSRELVEASPFDRIWGVGFAAKGAEGRRDKWGMNLLGKCLMEVREEFRKEAEAARVESGEGA